MLKENIYKPIFCPNCFSNNITIDNEMIKVSQDTWENSVNEYFKLVPEYLKQQCNIDD